MGQRGRGAEGQRSREVEGQRYTRKGKNDRVTEVQRDKRTRTHRRAKRSSNENIYSSICKFSQLPPTRNSQRLRVQRSTQMKF